MKRRLLPVLAGVLMAHATGQVADAIDEAWWYRLTNASLGESYSLDTANDGINDPMMAPTGNYSGQFWRFSAEGSAYRMTNAFLGLGRSLDNIADGSNPLFMCESNQYKGQRWHLTPAGEGYFRLTNDDLGDSRPLDTRPEWPYRPFPGKTGNSQSQLWKLTKVRRR